MALDEIAHSFAFLFSSLLRAAFRQFSVNSENNVHMRWGEPYSMLSQLFKAIGLVEVVKIADFF